MLKTYKGTLKDSRIEWALDAVPPIRPGQEVQVEVNILDPLEVTDEQVRRMVAALKKIADSGGVKSIPDPVAWQREMRKDRPLPGREE